MKFDVGCPKVANLGVVAHRILVQSQPIAEELSSLPGKLKLEKRKIDEILSNNTMVEISISIENNYFGGEHNIITPGLSGF